MSNITVCARFRPLNSKERRDPNNEICIRGLDSETFVFKDGKDEQYTFSFDRVFYLDSQQADVYEFLALPIVRDVVNGINGTIITYGQTGAGKTYSMEGPSITDCDELEKGLLPRVVDGLFNAIQLSSEKMKYTIKLSMVEIYLEKVRDLFDLSKDNIQIKECKVQGMLLSGVTEIPILDRSSALISLSRGIGNRAVGETQMNMESSRSHCIYILTIQQEVTNDKRVKTGKLVLVDLAGSEKTEKTGAEGKVLDEAKTINKSLSALGNVISALTCGPQGKASHIPYRDSKLTRLLQDALGGNSQTALMCCCSPSPSNATESLSTLRFGARAKHVKSSPHVNQKEDKQNKKNEASSPVKDESCERIPLVKDESCERIPLVKDESCERILDKLREKLDVEDVKLLEELFILEGIFFDPYSVEEIEPAYEDITFKTISSLQAAVEELVATNEELKRENKTLGARLATAARSDAAPEEVGENATFLHKMSGFLQLVGCYILLLFKR